MIPQHRVRYVVNEYYCKVTVHSAGGLSCRLRWPEDLNSRRDLIVASGSVIGDPMNIVWTTLIGLVAGVIARVITPGRKGPFGFILTALLGIIGAFGAAYLGQEAGWFSAGDNAGLVGATFGAVLVLLIWAMLFRSRRPTSSI